MEIQTKLILKSCHACQTEKYPNLNTYVEMGNRVVRDKRTLVCVDFLKPLPRGSLRLRQLIVFPDVVTKAVIVYAVTRPATKTV